MAITTHEERPPHRPSWRAGRQRGAGQKYDSRTQAREERAEQRRAQCARDVDPAGPTLVAVSSAVNSSNQFTRSGIPRVISRFGVMFFDDPVGAFANPRRAARDEATLRGIAWRSAAENPFMTTAERAAAPLLPNLHARRPDAPGQFAFANSHRVYTILEASGWGEIDIRPIDVECTLPEKELVRYVTRLGPVGLILQDADDRTRAQVIETVRGAFNPFVQGAEVRFTAACWMVGCQSGCSGTLRPS